MNYKETFTQEEWSTLEDSIYVIIFAIAGADKKVDRKEKRAIETLFNFSHVIDNKLLNTLLRGMNYNEEKIQTIEIENYKDKLKEVSDLLDKNLPEDKSWKFKKYLIAAGMYVANASGDLFGPKMSEVEAEAVIGITESLSISIEKLNVKP